MDPASPVVVRAASPEDAAAVQGIYAPIVTSTAISFEYEVPSIEDMEQRISAITRSLPWLVAEIDRTVAGYAYAASHRDRAAYGWSVDTSVYVSERSRGSGVGRLLYARLFDELISAGYVSAYAGITLPNEASVGLHEACGFRRVGVFPQVGYKLGRWHDVGWWHRPLTDPRANVAPPTRWSPER